MRLLFFDTEIPDLLADNGRSTGGACVRQYALAQGLAHLGQDVGILTWKGARDYVNKDLDFELVETYDPVVRIRGLRYFIYLQSFYRNIRSFQPDFLFVKTCTIHNGLLAICAQLLNIPLIYLVTNDKDADDRYKEGADYKTQLAYRYALKKSKMIVCQNRYQHDRFKEMFPEKHLMIMHNPYLEQGPLPDALPKTQRSYISWIGVFSKQKNLPTLLKVIRALPDQDFKIAGSFNTGLMDGQTSVDKALDNTLSQIESCNNAELVGYVRRVDIGDFLAKSTLLLNTSHYEGFSNTFLEAFAVGTPIVTTRNVDPDHIIERNQLGGVAETFDQLPHAIKAIENHPDYHKISRDCQQYLQTHHRMEVICQQLIDGVCRLQTIDSQNVLAK